MNEHTLVPRPETEELVHLISQRTLLEKGSVLDIGTGSGCIAIAIAKRFADCRIFATDISIEALELAAGNAAGNDVNVSFMQADILNLEPEGEFDLILSNPPYIPEREKKEMDRQVLEFDPGMALFVPDHDPLLFYKAIATYSEEHLRRNGEVFLETHEDFAHQVAGLFPGSYRVEVLKDFYDKDRFVHARKE